MDGQTTDYRYQKWAKAHIAMACRNKNTGDLLFMY